MLLGTRQGRQRWLLSSIRSVGRKRPTEQTWLATEARNGVVKRRPHRFPSATSGSAEAERIRVPDGFEDWADVGRTHLWFVEPLGSQGHGGPPADLATKALTRCRRIAYRWQFASGPRNAARHKRAERERRERVRESRTKVSKPRPSLPAACASTLLNDTTARVPSVSRWRLNRAIERGARFSWVRTLVVIDASRSAAQEAAVRHRTRTGGAHESDIGRDWVGIDRARLLQPRGAGGRHQEHHLT
jgi:hypothetical protein